MAGTCDLLLEDGTSILLEDGSGSLLLENCVPVAPGVCDLLLEDGTSILLEDGTGALLLENCLSPVTETPPQGGFIIIPRRRRPVAVRIPLVDDDEDEAVALAVLEALRDRRKLSG